MTDFFPIKVESHSGYKADEYPRCFYWKEEKYTIIKMFTSDPEVIRIGAEYLVIVSSFYHAMVFVRGVRLSLFTRRKSVISK